MSRLKKEYFEFKLLLKSVPSLVITLFVISIFSMNLLANKSISLPYDWMALDSGFIISWLIFLLMDIVTKQFGPKAATELSIFSILISLLFCLLFYFASIIPGEWGESYIDGSETIINNALNKTIGGTWYVILGSAVAFIVSSFVNNFSNWGIGKMFKKNQDGIGAYVMRTYVSTMIGQFVDNFVFAILVSKLFFSWTLIQCLVCSLTGMIAELLFEIIFSYFGYKICNRWKSINVGKEYLDYRNNLKGRK